MRYNRSTQSASADEVERVIREWLRTAADRDGGRRRRDLGKQPMPSAAPAPVSPATDDELETSLLENDSSIEQDSDSADDEL